MSLLRHSLWVSSLFCISLVADSSLSLESFMEESIVEKEIHSLEPPEVKQETAQAFTPPLVKAISMKEEAPFHPFTGKTKGRNVRVRLDADTESHIVQELGKNELVSVTGQKGNFWIIEPPENLKAYVFRSFILDDVVEGNRVNVRLSPSLDAPIIGHLNAGDKVKGSISALNQKWLEISPPAHTKFYISKDFIDYAGGPEFKTYFDKRHLAAEELLDGTALLAKSELRKPFDEIDFERVSKGFNTIISDYHDFPEHVEQARNALASFQENYLQKRLMHLETTSEETAQKATLLSHSHKKQEAKATDKMKLWEPVEQALYVSWAGNGHDKKSNDQFYEEQELAAETITGILEPYHSPVKAKPGDFILRNHDIPVAYVYSTKINLQGLVGEQVTLKVASRPNNNFAFPAYYVLGAE